jgi:hypothetical protein
MSSILNNEQLRRSRIAEGFLQVQNFASAAYAARVMAALEKLPSHSQITEIKATGDAMRNALFSPTDDYVIQLLNHLPASASTTWFHDTPSNTQQVSVPAFHYYHFPAMHHVAPYDAIVYLWDDEPQHQYMRFILQAYPGIVVLKRSGVAEEVLHHAQAVIVSSDQAMKRISARCNLPVHRIYMGTDLDGAAHHRARVEVRAVAGLQRDAFAVGLFIDDARPQEISEALSGFREFRQSAASTSLVVFGRPHRLRLKQITDFCRVTGLMHCLRFAGEERKYLLGIDVFIDLSTDVTITAMSALAAGNAVIVGERSDVVEFPDTVCWKFGGTNGRRELVEFLCALYKDAAARAHLSGNAQMFARGAEWPLIVEQLVAAVRSIIAEAGTGEAVAL